LKLKKFSTLVLICWVYLLATILLIPGDISAYEKTFAWDASDDPDLEGYILYSSVGDPCPPYNYVDTYPEEELANPLSPMAVVTNLEYNTRYYFTLTAYDTNGYESGYSNIITVYNEQWGQANCNSLNAGLSDGGGGSSGGGCYISTSVPRVQEGQEIIKIICLLAFGLFGFVVLKRGLSKLLCASKCRGIFLTFNNFIKGN
jgi:hypothetical protein